MKRTTLIKIHLYLSAFFAPLILLMAFSGTAYLNGFKGSMPQTAIKEVESVEVVNEDFIKEQLKLIDANYTFEYIKESGQKTITRPTTREYYQFTKNGSNVQIHKITPDLVARLMEAHKGHGPGLFKLIEKIFGFSLMLILISGIWLALAVKRDFKITLMLMGIGFAFTATLIFLL